MASSDLYEIDSLLKLTSAGNFTAARDYLLSVQNKAGNYTDSIHVEFLIALGEVSTNAQKEGEGFKTLQFALALAKKTQNKYLISKARIQLIEFYRKIREYDNAQTLIKVLLKELPINVELKCRFYHRASAVYNELYDAKNGTVPEYLDTALYYSYNSLAISKKHHLYDHQFTSYRELSTIYNSTSFLHSMNKSKLYLDSALMTTKIKSELAYHNLLKVKAHLFLNNNEIDSSLYYAKKAITFIESTNNYQLQMEIYWVLSKSYFALNDSLTGYKYMVKEARSDVKYRESFAKNKLAEITTAYQVEAKDKLIAQNREELLEADKTMSFYFYLGVLLVTITLFIIFYSYKTKRKNKLLAKLVNENNFLIGESNHRIKNNLQLIISLIGREIYKSDQAKNELREVSEKINTIAALHQLLYVKDTKDKISLKSYLKSIEDNFNSGFIEDGIKLSLEVEDFEMPIERSVYLGLLVTELITNSLKYAFKGNDEKIIKLSAWKSNSNTINLIYKDNGIGLKSGESPALVNLLLKQLRASVTAKNTMGYSLFIKFEV
ncbi:MAG: sensor histidine kinase [Flavobacteriales bacterium]|nr:sensor histidine kinase [Flavobacteriales bacterium]